MKNPKLLLYWLTLLSIYGIACSQAPNKEPKVQLEQLRKQQAELSSKIRNLENKETVAGIIDSALINFKQVAISPVQVVDFVHTIEVQGKVESDQNIEVNPKIAGIITKIQVTEGQKVAKGQVLATIDNQILQPCQNPL
jgi:membrane fusion protein (multidrug efflux system)